MLLHLDKIAFNQIVTEVADNLGFREDQIEKDYFVSVFLKELLSKTDLPIVFKGGTSLSKAYDVIDRFSEDLDLAVEFSGKRLGDGKRKKLKYQLLDTAENLSMKVINIDEIESDKDFNFYQIAFNNHFLQNETVLPYLLIETILSYQPYPCEEKIIYNYITKYLLAQGNEDIVKKYELQPFPASVQTLERTFIDKLFALCDYHIEKKYDRYSRHLYDIHKIWISGLLRKDIISELILPVVKDRQLFGVKNHSCMPNAKPNEILKQIIKIRAYEKDYNEVTSDFILTPVAYETCISSLSEIIEKKYIPDLISNFK